MKRVLIVPMQQMKAHNSLETTAFQFLFAGIKKPGQTRRFTYLWPYIVIWHESVSPYDAVITWCGERCELVEKIWVFLLAAQTHHGAYV